MIHPFLTMNLLPIFLVRIFASFYQPPRRLSGGESTRIEQDMQNKPNFIHFCAKNHDSSKKQTQTNPIQNHFYPQKPTPKQKTKPIQTQNKPNLCWSSCPNPACGITKLRKAKKTNPISILLHFASTKYTCFEKKTGYNDGLDKYGNNC